MDFKQLEAFAYVVENRSFSKAAEILHLTQPTISSHISSLERELNIKLIVRTTKETYPSSAGEILYRYARQMLQLRESAVQAIHLFTKEMKGTITLAASTIPAQYFLPRLMQAFRHQYPDIIFQLKQTDSSEVVEAVVGRSVELGFTGTRINNPKCLYTEFANDKLMIITPNHPNYHRYLGGPFPLKQLMRESFISREPGSGTRRETESFFKQMGLDPARLQIAAEVRSTESIKKMVSEGMGIAVISKSAAEDYVQCGKLLAFDFDGVDLRRKLYIAQNRNGNLSPIKQVFYEYAKNIFIK